MNKQAMVPLLALCATAAMAEVTVTGDIDPVSTHTYWTADGSRYSHVTVGATGVGSVLLDNDSDLIAYDISIGTESSATGIVTVDGAGTRWDNDGPLFVGDYGNGRLNILNGGYVTSNRSGYAYGDIIGQQAGSTGAVTVDGVGSTWDNSMVLVVGNSGNGTLDITGGGQVNTGGNVRIASGPGTTSAATVDGVGSSLVCYGNTFSVGTFGEGTLDITNGAEVAARRIEMGTRPGSTGVVTVDGASSIWTEWGIVVGIEGQALLNITDGAQVTTLGSTEVGRAPGSTGEIHFENGHLVTVGLLAGVNDLTGTGTIDTNGLVSDVDLVFDATHGLSQTLVLNSNPGQAITINLNVNGDGPMGAGQHGAGSMRIADGRDIDSSYGRIGAGEGSAGVVTVEGHGSSWSTGAFLVGYYGDAQLAVTGGGDMTSGTSYIGYKSGSSGAVTVDGNGSTWANRGDLYLGYGGSGEMNISNGGQVSNDTAKVGYGTGADTVTVSGAGSTWTSSEHVYIGYSGPGFLTISDGGQVSNGGGTYDTYVGYGGPYGSTSGNTVTVDGAGSTWTTGDQFYLGYGDAGNLHISNGGYVSSYDAYTGYKDYTTSAVTVDGVGSTWDSERYIIVGYRGRSTLDITNGAHVTSSIGWMASSSSGARSVVTVAGAGSMWTNSGDFEMGRNGDATLAIVDGGLVIVGGTLRMNMYLNSETNINMDRGGMLALNGQADASLEEFCSLIEGTDALRYWDAGVSDWSMLTGARVGIDYRLAYQTQGDLAGYTVLTVIPEPATMSLLALGGLGVLWRRKK